MYSELLLSINSRSPLKSRLLDPSKTQACKNAFWRKEVRPAVIALVCSYLKEKYITLIACIKRKVIQKKKITTMAELTLKKNMKWKNEEND